MKKLLTINKIPILTYHRIVPKPLYNARHGIWVTARNFRRQMRLLSLGGFNTISLDMLLSANKGINQLPKKPIIITFDDGYEDNYLHAFPILKKYNFTATIFLVSGYIGKDNHWDEIYGEEIVSLLSLDEIKEMFAYGISFGAHSVTHPHLSQLKGEQVFKEIVQSKKGIEEMLNQEITSFCYPYGEFNQAVKQMVIDAGFKCACACDTEINDLYELRRIQIFPKTDLFGFWRKTQQWYYRYKRLKISI